MEALTQANAPAKTARRSTVYVYMVSLVAATSGLLFGFDIAVINGALLFLKQQFGLTEAQTEIAASSLLAGCVAGASVAGWLSDRYGRRLMLILSAVLFGLSAIGAALPNRLDEFAAARFAGGLAIGVASLLAPLYIAEVAPARIRGRLVSLNQMAIVSGILLAYLVNWGLSTQGQDSWRWMFAAAVLPSAFFLVALFFVPESPRWLVKMNRRGEAMAVLRRVNSVSDADAELRRIEETIAEESGTLGQLLEPGMRRALVIAVVLAVLQQVTGINTVLFYGALIFKERVAGQTETAAIGANVVVGLINFLSTIIALWVIDKAGRKPLLIISAAILGSCEIALGLAFLQPAPPAVLILTIMGVCGASFAVGLGPGVWVVLSEIFPTRIRGRAMSIATVSLWVACVVLTFTFLTLARTITISGAFWVYAAMCAVTVVFVWRVTPETKGRTLEEIERLWKSG